MTRLINFTLTSLLFLGITQASLYGQGTIIDLAQVPADVTILPEAENGHFGVSAVALDFNDDGFTDFAFGANRASAPTRIFPGGFIQDRRQAGKVYLFYGRPTMPALIDLRAENADITFYNASRQTYLGTALTKGDVNGDGIDDLIMGTSQTKAGIGYGAASVYVIYGRSGPDAIPSGKILDFQLPDGESADVRIANITNFEGQGMGTYLASGDIDGDGYDDVLMTAPGATISRAWGVIYTVFGSSSLPSVITVNESSSSWQLRFTGIPFANQAFGRGIHSADINEDGIDDLVIGDPTHASAHGTFTLGSAFVIYGRPEFSTTYLNGTYSLNSHLPDLTFSWVGQSVAFGDINDDGHLDLLFAKRNNSKGSFGIFVKYGGPFLTQTNYLFNSSQPNYTRPDLWLTGVGSRVAAADVNGDGVDDILASDNNQVVVAFSDPDFPPNHVISYPGAVDIQILGDEPSSKGSTIGSSLMGGDVNGDGTADIIFGAQYRDNGAFQEAGAGFIVNGIPVAIPVLISPADGSFLNDNLPTFDWTDVTDLDGVTYQLQVDNDPDFLSPEIDVSGLTLSTFTTLTALLDDTYHWRVRAEDGAGNIGSFTSAFTFQLNTQCVPIPSGLVSWWPGDGNANHIVNGNNGTLVNGATFAPGFVGQAFSLDGVNDFVTVPDAANLKFGPNSPMTIELWAFRTSNAPAQHILGKRLDCGGSNFDYQMAYTGVLSFGSLSGSVGTGPGLMPLNTWTHLAATFGRGYLRLLC